MLSLQKNVCFKYVVCYSLKFIRAFWKMFPFDAKERFFFWNQQITCKLSSATIKTALCRNSKLPECESVVAQLQVTDHVGSQNNTASQLRFIIGRLHIAGCWMMHEIYHPAFCLTLLSEFCCKLFKLMPLVGLFMEELKRCQSRSLLNLWSFCLQREGPAVLILPSPLWRCRWDLINLQCEMSESDRGTF